MLENLFKNMPFFKTLAQTSKRDGQIFSYLLVCEDIESTKIVAKLLAQMSLCEDLCGVCENCKKILHNSHPDVKVFPEKDRLMVEDSKKIVEESFIKPIFANKKIIIINNIQDSTEQAQNKLLKTLEEPAENVVFILTSSSLEKILPTVRSRCFKVAIPSIDKTKILPYLSGDERSQKLAIALGNGYVTKSIELSKVDNLNDIFDLTCTLFLNLFSSKEAILFSKRLLDEKDRFALILEMFCLIIEDAVMFKANKHAVLRLDSERKKIEEIANLLSIRCLLRLSGLALEASKQLSYNVNIQLIIDNLVMNILEVKYLCK